nr:RHS repeat-associated core domain-containing protein [uncultured Psychroserpens sp.]
MILDYYPFGLKHKGYNNNVSANVNSAARKFMFGGKEFGEELGLDWYDVSARNYDPALGRWMNLDPLAEKMRRHSPYNYAFNNPIYFIDYDGMMPTAGDPLKKVIIGGRQSGLLNQTGRARHVYSLPNKPGCNRCGASAFAIDNHTLPSSRFSNTGSKTIFSTQMDDFSATIITGKKAKEFSYSVSEENITQSSQYFDSDGKVV